MPLSKDAQDPQTILQGKGWVRDELALKLWVESAILLRGRIFG